MVKRRTGGKAPPSPGPPLHHHSNSNSNNNNNATTKHLPHHNGKTRSSVSPIRSSHWTSTAFLKASVLIFIATVSPVLILKDFGFTRTEFESESSSKDDSGVSFKENGGWRLPDSDTLKRFDSDYCNIDRISVTDLDPVRFEKEFRYKRPVIVTFPNGASDWTEPQKWSLEYLKKSYGEWKITSGNSVEIIRRGGSGDVTSSFEEFASHLMQERGETDGHPPFYMFDRTFYKDSELPGTFILPTYFSNDYDINDSIFFLGASGSGVVFHKHADTWNAVVFGKKRWFLYPITRTPPGGVYHGYTLLDWYERVYPNLTASQRPLECTQQGGEILYLPEGFYHATLNIGDTIAVAQQKKQPKLVAEKIMYEVTALNRQLEDDNTDDKDRKDIHQKLLDNFLKLRELLPENSEMAMKLGEKFGDLGHHHRAVEMLQKAVDMDPYFVLAYSILGTNLASLGRHEEAEAALIHAIKLSPGVWDVYKDYSVYLMQRARYKDAIPVLKKGTELNPMLIPFWSYLRVAQEKTGDMEGARETQAKIDELKQTIQG